jgi:hypothetical protein
MKRGRAKDYASRNGRVAVRVRDKGIHGRDVVWLRVLYELGAGDRVDCVRGEVGGFVEREAHVACGPGEIVSERVVGRL